MIPSDVASRLQLTADAAVTRTPTSQQVSDALSDLVPGQRVLAEIQAMLPTGAYRALINQRDVTLALPFSAKAGDSLELEVVDNDGRLTLAVVGRRGEGATTAPPTERPAVETTLSRTGNFIAGLLGKGEEGSSAKPAPLNANQPIANAPPAKAADLVPFLKQAITQSGMFYESHQAQWVDHKLPIEILLAQPQGKLSSPSAGQPPTQMPFATTTAGQSPTPSTFATLAQSAFATLARAGESAQAQATLSAPTLAEEATEAKAPPTSPADTTTKGALSADAKAAIGAVYQESMRQAALPAAGPAPGQIVAGELVPLVQQQLEALANQTYVWQGLAWPGQPMRWEIEEDGHRNADGEPAAQAQWQTRLTLVMPQLGEVRAAIRLNGGEISLVLSAADDVAAVRLREGGDELRENMAAAGLALSGLSVGRHERTES